MRRLELEGRKFGRLTVLKRDECDPRFAFCVCECGNEKRVRVSHLCEGTSKSCGCLSKEATSKRNKKHGQTRKDAQYHRLYVIWTSMNARCSNPKSASYRFYGARGIYVCPEWREFQEFMNWALKNGYDDNLTIERIDVNGPYDPANCTWIPLIEQCTNRRNNHRIAYDGEDKLVTQWAKELGVSSSLISMRISQGYSEVEAIQLGRLKPTKVKVRCVETGEEFESVAEAARQRGVIDTYIWRVLRGDRKTYKGQHWERV